MTSAPILPNYLGLPFRILVSPFVNFDPINRVTDIMMFNTRNLGALIVDEDPHVKSWEDGQYNIQNMSVEETYGFGILNEGQAIAVAKNVKIRPNEFVMPARSVFNLASRLPHRPSSNTRRKPPSGLFATIAIRCRIRLRDRATDHAGSGAAADIPSGSNGLFRLGPAPVFAG
jgi:hypothetical protein